MCLLYQNYQGIYKNPNSHRKWLPCFQNETNFGYDKNNIYIIHNQDLCFLQKQLQGKILESNVKIAHNWWQDAGIYKPAMEDTGDMVVGV